MNSPRIKWVVIFGALAMAGCQEETVQRYQTAKPTPSGGVLYDVPAGWTKSTRQVPMSIANFQIIEGEQSADMTITPLPGPAGGLVENINRWRRQINLSDASANEIREQAKETLVAGAAATAIDLIGPESDGPKRQRILGVVWPRGGKTWFFKMKGPADLVAKQQPAFDAFVRSVRLAGANDG